MDQNQEQKYTVMQVSDNVEPYQIGVISPTADIVYVNEVYDYLHPEVQNFVLLDLHFYRETKQIFEADRHALHICYNRGYNMERILTMIETTLETIDRFYQNPSERLKQKENGLADLQKQYKLNQQRLEQAKNVVFGGLQTY